MVEREYVDEELSKAHQALDDAEELVAADGSTEGIDNRLYYAAFHAAQAALFERGIEPRTHGAVRNLFGEHLVLDGDASRVHGRLLTTLADLRQQADYGYEPIAEDIDQLADRTSEFVRAMQQLAESADDGE